MGGFLIFFYSSTSIYLITVISFERYLMITKPFTFKNLKMSLSIRIIFVCAFAAFVVTVLPCIGWSYYKFYTETYECNIEWTKPTANVRSYIGFIVLALFVVPLGLIIFTSTKSYRKVNIFTVYFQVTVCLIFHVKILVRHDSTDLY